MTPALLAIVAGVALLVWSADKFVDGASAAATCLGVPKILVGMVVVGLGTSMPELVVSAISASQGNPGLALGNAYGSNIANITLILGATAVINPVSVHAQFVRRELPMLLAVTALAAWQARDGFIDRFEAGVLLGVFIAIMAWSIAHGLRMRRDDREAADLEERAEAADSKGMPLGRAGLWLVVGLAVMAGSSRLLVWGAVTIAAALGVSDLVIGLTIVAIGTSLPELASSIAAARKGHHDIAVGNVVGSNMFNTLAVVGLAGMIEPMAVPREVLSRDMLCMAVLTAGLWGVGIGRRNRPGGIGRIEGIVLLAAFVLYNCLVAGIL